MRALKAQRWGVGWGASPPTAWTGCFPWKLTLLDLRNWGREEVRWNLPAADRPEHKIRGCSPVRLLVNYSFKSICLLEEGEALTIFVKCLWQHKEEMPLCWVSLPSWLEVNELPQNRKVNLYRISLTLCINGVSHLVTNEALYILICTKINTTIQINTQTVQNNLLLPHLFLF